MQDEVTPPEVAWPLRAPGLSCLPLYARLIKQLRRQQAAVFAFLLLGHAVMAQTPLVQIPNNRESAMPGESEANQPQSPQTDSTSVPPTSNPNDPWANARHLQTQRKWAEAEAELRKQVAALPDYPEGYVLLGAVLRRTGKTKEAITWLQKALDLNPGHRPAHEVIGTIYLMERQPEKAKEHLAILRRTCLQHCHEVRRLSEAIATYSP